MAYAKWIGGAVGWALGGPIGGVMGYWLGKMFSDDSLAMDGGMPGGAGTGLRLRTFLSRASANFARCFAPGSGFKISKAAVAAARHTRPATAKRLLEVRVEVVSPGCSIIFA